MQEIPSPSAAADQSCRYQYQYQCHQSFWRWRRRTSIPSFLVSIIQCLIIAASSSSASDVSPHGNARDIPSARELQDKDLDYRGPDGTCNNLIRTRAIQDVYLGQGIFFAIQSDDDDDEGLMITSFGFHLDLPTLKFNGDIGYEVYALREEGYYASPERQSDISGAIDVTEAGASWYDYRVDSDILKNWEKIAEGTLVSADLTLDSTTLAVSDSDFYQIPLGTFRSYVPPNGGIRSFFIVTDAGAFVYSNVDNGVNVNEEMSVLGTTAPGDYAPKLLIGEGIVSYPPLPDAGFLYQTRAFVGKVFYEKECPSSAPSLSTSPSSAPTVALSEVPSLAPSLSLVPSYAPSPIPSELPSLSPTQQFVQKIEAGVKVSFAGIDCEPGKPIEGIKAIEGSIKQVAEEVATEESPYISNVNATVMGTFCTLPDPFERYRRRLPTGSSALDFSVVVTGEYRPPQRPGQRPPPIDIDLGKATEDSINRDPVGFVKDIKARAGTASVFADVEPEDLSVQAFEVPEDPAVLAYLEITSSPTKNPTPRPTVIVAAKEAEEKEEKSNDNILIICIVIVGGLIVLLGAFLLFRHGERKAAKTRKKKLEREMLQKERMREERRQQAEWDQANKRRQAGGSRDDDMKDMGRGGQVPQYGNPSMPAYGQPPHPPPNYYAGGPPPPVPPPPQGYNYNYPQPPPPYGQSYGGSNQQGYSYPPAPPVPPMAGASYDQQPQRR